MRFMIIHKTSARWEAGEVPSPELIRAVGKLIGELQRAGVLRAGEGLRASSLGARIRLSGGKPSVVPGPFEGHNELPARYAIVRTRSLEEAVEVATRLGAITGAEEVDVRPVTEPWDIGMTQKPEGLTTTRFMAVSKATPSTEAGKPLAPTQQAALRQLTDALTRDGVLLASEGLEPSAKGKRLRRAPGPRGSRPLVFDGPFAETKELIAGFVIVEVGSPEEALRWAESYLEIVEAEEVEVLGLTERG